jgi:hypothetical protein
MVFRGLPRACWEFVSRQKNLHPDLLKDVIGRVSVWGRGREHRCAPVLEVELRSCIHARWMFWVALLSQRVVEMMEVVTVVCANARARPED